MNKKIYGFVVCMLVMVMGICCVSVSANVRVFVTGSQDPYGLERVGLPGFDPWHPSWLVNPFRPTYYSMEPPPPGYEYEYDYYYGYYRVPTSQFPPIDAPSGTAENPILINVGNNQWGYIWFQFQNEPLGAKVMGLQVIAYPAAGQPEPTPDLEFTYYVQNDLLNPDPGMGAKRWNGIATPPNYPEWHNNPQTFIAVTSAGIVNGAENPELMFHDQGGNPPAKNGVALLGSVRGLPNDTVYKLQISNIEYQSPPDPIVSGTFFKLITSEVIGDMNCDGYVNFGDINPFILALTNPEAYQQEFPCCNILNGDINGDGLMNFGDINPFVALLSGR